MIKAGQIIKNLILAEAVTIIKVQQLANMYSISYTGINSNKTNTKVIDEAEFQTLEVLTSEGSFNFSGNPVRFSLFAEDERDSVFCGRQRMESKS